MLLLWCDWLKLPLIKAINHPETWTKLNVGANVGAGLVVLLVTAVPALRAAGEPDERDQAKLEEKLWDPECPLTNKQIDQFLVVAR